MTDVDEVPKSIGTCIPCVASNHNECNGNAHPWSSGCKCADREHQPVNE